MSCCSEDNKKAGTTTTTTDDCCADNKGCCGDNQKDCCDDNQKDCCGDNQKGCCDGGDQQQEGGCCGGDNKNDTTEGCCGGDGAAAGKKSDQEVVEMVRAGYAEVSKKTTAGRTEDAKVEADRVAEGMGYSADELASVPGEANMGLQCGNPTKTADLKPGEVVVDLGSGGGIDVFLAAKKVGPTGKAIGVDMTTEMIEQARASAEQAGIKNVEFVQSNITDIKLPDNCADVIISNCVINLAPNKMDVFKEMFRILKPGGRVAVSDVVLTTKPMPPAIKNSVTLLVGCVAGAITAADYTEGLKQNGFVDTAVTPGGQDLNSMWHPEKQNKNANSASSCCTTTCCGVTCDDVNISELEKFDINEYVFSGKVTGIKPQPVGQK